MWIDVFSFSFDRLKHGLLISFYGVSLRQTEAIQELSLNENRQLITTFRLTRYCLSCNGFVSFHKAIEDERKNNYISDASKLCFWRLKLRGKTTKICN